MLLGTSNNNTHQQRSEAEFIAILIGQNRYAEAYVLLKAESVELVTTQYNLALCHYFAGNYREALLCLDKAQMLLQPDTPKTNLHIDGFYKAIRERQNQVDDHHRPIIQRHVALTAHDVADGIIRLKTDCWLQLGDYARVIDTAARLAYKNYANITAALSTARKKVKRNE